MARSMTRLKRHSARTAAGPCCRRGPGHGWGLPRLALAREAICCRESGGLRAPTSSDHGLFRPAAYCAGFSGCQVKNSRTRPGGVGIGFADRIFLEGPVARNAAVRLGAPGAEIPIQMRAVDGHPLRLIEAVSEMDGEVRSSSAITGDRQAPGALAVLPQGSPAGVPGGLHRAPAERGQWPSSGS